jgi:hypothetical protein
VLGTVDVAHQQVEDQDRGHQGSRFSDVVAAIFANPYQRTWGAPGEPPLPVHEVSFRTVVGGLVPRQFTRDSERTLDSHADLRWGADGKGFRRLVHPNGVCLLGRWIIDQENSFSGCFRAGSEALVVARYSTCCTETRRGHNRSLSLVAKLYPTTDSGHVEPLQTASLFTQEDIGGSDTPYLNDVELLNAPNVTLSRRGIGAPVLVVVGLVFQRVDREPTVRQLYQIAELGKAPGEPTRAPEFLRLLVVPEQPRIQGPALDFRDEVMAQIFDAGDPVPKRTLTFSIEVTDEGETQGNAARLRRTFRSWRRIGSLVFDNAVVSRNGDCVVHFNHPTWRTDRNDPATATRVDGRRVVK